MTQKQIYNNNFRIVDLIMELFKSRETTTSQAKAALQLVMDNLDKCSTVSKTDINDVIPHN